MVIANRRRLEDRTAQQGIDDLVIAKPRRSVVRAGKQLVARAMIRIEVANERGGGCALARADEKCVERLESLRHGGAIELKGLSAPRFVSEREKERVVLALERRGQGRRRRGGLLAVAERRVDDSAHLSEGPSAPAARDGGGRDEHRARQKELHPDTESQRLHVRP